MKKINKQKKNKLPFAFRADFTELDRVVVEYERSHPLTLKQKYRLLDGMYDLAKRFGHFRPENAMEGIENKIEIARILNGKVR